MRLGDCLRDYRQARALGVRAMSRTIGISAATLSRIERGKPADQRSLMRVFRWLFLEGR